MRWRLDAHCGMAGRFMVPELERVTAFPGARLVPAEVEDSLAELLPQGPSCTAIQHLLAAVGHHAEEAADALEEAMEAQVAAGDGRRYAGGRMGWQSTCPCAMSRDFETRAPAGAGPKPRTRPRPPPLGRKQP